MRALESPEFRIHRHGLCGPYEHLSMKFDFVSTFPDAVLRMFGSRLFAEAYYATLCLMICVLLTRYMHDGRQEFAAAISNRTLLVVNGRITLQTSKYISGARIVDERHAIFCLPAKVER